MIYLVRGNVKSIFQAFDQVKLIQKNTFIQLSASDIQAQDLPKTPFIGTEEQAVQFATVWKNETKESYYLSGNIGASGYIPSLMGKIHPLKQPHETLAAYQHQTIRQSFAFLNDTHAPCAVSIVSRRDQPDQWMLVLVKNTHLEPAKRDMLCFSGFNLKPLISSESPDFPVYSTQALPSYLLKKMDSSFITEWLSAVLQAQQGRLHPNFSRLNLLLRPIQPTRSNLLLDDPIVWRDFDPISLLQTNPTLDLFMQHGLDLPQPMVKQCLTENSPLRQQIENMPFTDNNAINKNLLEMILVFFQAGILETHQQFLHEQMFKRTRAGSIWDAEQIRLIPPLLQCNYPLELFQQILSKKAYYMAVSGVLELGLSQDIPLLFQDKNKLKELELIQSKTRGSTQTLCLVFWAKADLTTDEYNQIISAAQQHPLMANTLLALDKRHIHSMEELKQMALRPKKHYQQSLLHHFAHEFTQFNLNPYALNRLNQDELTALNSCFELLKQADCKTADFYRLTIKDDNQAQLIRTLLPGLALVKDTEHKKALITLLFAGIQSGPITQGKAILALQDNHLKCVAKRFQEQFVCTKTMQMLGFSQQEMNLACADSSKGNQLRRVILEVEAQCKKIHERLSENSSNQVQIEQWRDIDEHYRKTVYKLTFDALTHSSIQFKKELKQAQALVMAIIDPDNKSWIEKMLIRLANAIIYIVTLGHAHSAKEKATGNYWFFTHTKSGEEVRALNKKITRDIEKSEIDDFNLEPPSSPGA